MTRPGPKTERHYAALRRVNVMIDRDTERVLKVLGGNNLSKGVREAARLGYRAWLRDKGETK